MRRDQATLEIEAPLAQCGCCGYVQALSGTWSVEGGVLAFRADPDPLRRRGPDYAGCGESDHDGRGYVSFTRIEAGDVELTGEQVAELRASAEAAAWD
jgi:hypothetical protein